MKKAHKNGFTLVELSIVLVIIGLLVGGVLQGRELIVAAKRNATISEMTQLSVAINTFRLQYSGFPGDFDEAQDYWGATVRKGDGNGKVGGTSADWSTTNEFIAFWDHLELSELYKLEENIYTAKKNLNSIDNTSAIVSYKLPLSFAYWSETPTFKMKNKHGLYLVTSQPVSGPLLSGSLSVLDFLYPIDKKIDDGLPGRGNILAKNGGSDICVIDNGTDSNKYNLNSTTASETCIAMWYFE